MSAIEDDPREVLSVLNSLGFVGITAKQLQAFMKDLKLHRKIKERERQLWSEQTKKKIFMKQRQSLLDMMNGGSNENASPNVADDSVVNIKIKCVPELKIIDEVKSTVRSSRACHRNPLQVSRKEEPKTSVPSHVQRRKENTTSNVPPNSTKKIGKATSSQVERVTESPKQTASAPASIGARCGRSKSVASNSSEQKDRPRSLSRSLSRSRSKSFIRPWKLNSETQRVAHKSKSDPVSLYQKYQKEWKKVSFLGENRHDDVRWAVREKMLGIDPTPRPILKKSHSSMNIRKR